MRNFNNLAFSKLINRANVKKRKNKCFCGGCLSNVIRLLDR